MINYTLSILEQHDVALQDVEVVESFLLKAAVLSPSSMDRISRIILNLQDETKQVSRRRIGERFTRLAARNLENGNLYEAIWLVYTLRGLKFPLQSRRISDLIEGTASSALALILLDMKSKNLCVCNLPMTTWASKITKGSVGSSWIWLLGYEGIRHGWLSDPSNVMAGSLFQPMASRGVVFYDPRRNVLRSSKVVRLRNLSRRRNRFEMRKLIQRLRGFSFTDY